MANNTQMRAYTLLDAGILEIKVCRFEITAGKKNKKSRHFFVPAFFITG